MDAPRFHQQWLPDLTSVENFALSPDCRWLVCANRDTDNLVVFRVDPTTGRLTPTSNSATIAQPVCVLFVD